MADADLLQAIGGLPFQQKPAWHERGGYLHDERQERTKYVSER